MVKIKNPPKRPVRNPIVSMIVQQNPQYIKQENYLKSLHDVIMIRASGFSTIKMSIIHNHKTIQPNLKIILVGGLIKEEGEQSLLKTLASIDIEPDTTMSEVVEWFHKNTEHQL